MMLFVEALFGKEEPIGMAFISYSRNDEVFVKNVIESNFQFNQIPYFQDKKDILTGKTVDQVKKALERATCGVVILSEASINSQWVWFEFGILEGLGKTIIPFLAETRKTKKFISNLPDFARQYNILTDVNDVVNAVKAETFLSKELANDNKIDNSIASELRQIKLQLLIDIPIEIRPYIYFGFLLIKFGQHQALSQMPKSVSDTHGSLLLKPIKALRRDEDINTGTVKITFHVPVHKVLGVQFKPYIDVTDLEKIDATVALLRNEGLLDVSVSSSAEKQRIYFLFPSGQVDVITTPEGIKNNYIYPV